jgi:hypothetical protein
MEMGRGEMTTPRYAGLMVTELSQPMRAAAAAMAARRRIIERVSMRRALLGTACTFTGEFQPV